MTIYLGVDGGNTKTIALVTDASGAILGAGRAGCADIYNAASPEAGVAAITAAADAALAAAGLTRAAVDWACFSLAGADWDEDYAWLRAALTAAGLGQTLEVYNDALGALRAGVPDGVGAIIALGTGAATAARAADGTFWHPSFWQESLGGAEMGRQALTAIYRAELGIDPPTMLRDPVVAYLRQPHVEGVLRLFWTPGVRPPDSAAIARLAPIVLTAAGAGDVAARAIVEQHAERLVAYVLNAAQRVGLRGAYPVVLNGGVFRHAGRVLVDAIAAHLHRLAPDVTLVLSRHEPAVGAVLQAFALSGVTPDAALLARIEATLPPHSLFATVD